MPPLKLLVKNFKFCEEHYQNDYFLSQRHLIIVNTNHKDGSSKRYLLTEPGYKLAQLHNHLLKQKNRQLESCL